MQKIVSRLQEKVMNDNNASAMINGKPISVQNNGTVAATCTTGGAGNPGMAKKLDSCAAKGGSGGLGGDAANEIRNAAAD